jgi:hypothetical protein
MALGHAWKRACGAWRGCIHQTGAMPHGHVPNPSVHPFRLLYFWARGHYYIVNFNTTLNCEQLNSQLSAKQLTMVGRSRARARGGFGNNVPSGNTRGGGRGGSQGRSGGGYPTSSHSRGGRRGQNL